MVSRDIKLHAYLKKRLENYGFANVTVTALDRDALDRLLRELKPGLVIIEARFYECSTHYMMWELLQRFPKLNIAVFSIERYPANLGMKCIVNGVKSFVMFTDGPDEFEKGMRLIREGREYICPTVMDSFNRITTPPKPAEKITPRHCEIIRLNGNGFTAAEIGATLHIAESTIYNHKQEIFNTLNVRNEREMIRAARELGFFNDDELVFYGGNVEAKKKRKANNK